MRAFAMANHKGGTGGKNFPVRSESVMVETDILRGLTDRNSVNKIRKEKKK